MPCFFVSATELHDLITQGWYIKSGPFATQDECLAICEGSSSSLRCCPNCSNTPQIFAVTSTDFTCDNLTLIPGTFNTGCYWFGACSTGSGEIGIYPIDDNTIQIAFTYYPVGFACWIGYTLDVDVSDSGGQLDCCNSWTLAQTSNFGICPSFPDTINISPVDTCASSCPAKSSARDAACCGCTDGTPAFVNVNISTVCGISINKTLTQIEKTCSWSYRDTNISLELSLTFDGVNWIWALIFNDPFTNQVVLWSLTLTSFVCCSTTYNLNVIVDDCGDATTATLTPSACDPSCGGSSSSGGNITACGCVSVPATLTAAFSAADASCTALNGTSILLIYDAVSHHWKFSGMLNGQSVTMDFFCTDPMATTFRLVTVGPGGTSTTDGTTDCNTMFNWVNRSMGSIGVCAVGGVLITITP